MASRLPSHLEKGLKNYERDGFAVVRAFSPAETTIIEGFGRAWIYRLLDPWVAGRTAAFPLETYHLWAPNLGIDHGNLLRARNRYILPEEGVAKALINANVRALLDTICPAGWEPWLDFGCWLGFRLIRPGAGDGYPFSRKDWGPAKGVISFWIPVVGRGPKETLCILPGSHRKEYERILPEQDKFAKDEFRLAEPPRPGETIRPTLGEGEAIVYDPRLIHSEDVAVAEFTRFNLEIRFRPLPNSGLR